MTNHVSSLARTRSAPEISRQIMAPGQPPQTFLGEFDFLHQSESKWKWKKRQVSLSREAPIISYTDKSLYQKQQHLLKLTASSSVAVAQLDDLRETAFSPQPFLLRVEGETLDKANVSDGTSIVIFALSDDGTLNALKTRLEQVIRDIRSASKTPNVCSPCCTCPHEMRSELEQCEQMLVFGPLMGFASG